jgi:hypothetical protein
MSFRIDQLQELRTAPAAHEGRVAEEGPVRLPQAGPAMARHSWAVWWPMMAEGSWRPTSSILAAIAQRRAVRLMMVGAHCHGAASWRPLPVHGSNVDEARNAQDRREVPGRVGRVGRVWGGRPEAGLRPPFRVAPPREQPSLSFWLVPACRASDVRVRQGRAACYSRQAGCAGRQSGFHARSLRRGKSRQPTARGAHPGWGVRHGL